jgi:5-(carboxyamino)imidazole ribonucleotide mutase
MNEVNKMNPLASIIMGSTSDWPIMEQAAKIFEDFKIPFEINALSAHRTPKMVEEFASNAHKRGIKVIIAGAGGAAHLPGVIAAYTPLPVIGVPCRSSISIDGWDSILSILQMPPGIPVATVGLDAAMNAALLAVQIISTSNTEIFDRFVHYKNKLADKIVKANAELQQHDFKFKVKS